MQFLWCDRGLHTDDIAQCWAHYWLFPSSMQNPKGKVAVRHLELALINTLCDDLGAAIGAQLALSLLQARLTS